MPSAATDPVQKSRTEKKLLRTRCLRLRRHRSPDINRRDSVRILDEKKIDYKIIEYLKEPLDLEELKNILTILNLKPIDIVRTSEAEYKENKLSVVRGDKLLIAIIKFPKILQRPIIIKGDKGVIGRPPENVLKII